MRLVRYKYIKNLIITIIIHFLYKFSELNLDYDLNELSFKFCYRTLFNVILKEITKMHDCYVVEFLSYTIQFFFYLIVLFFDNFNFNEKFY